MRRQRLAAMGAVVTLFSLVACGRSGPGPLATDAAAPGKGAAQRYSVLTANPVCTPTPGTCTALEGAGTFNEGSRTVCFAVVDNPAGDDGIIFVTIGDITYGTTATNVVYANGVATITETIQDRDGNSHLVVISWGFGPSGVRSVIIDGNPFPVTSDGENVFPGQCTPPQGQCRV